MNLLDTVLQNMKRSFWYYLGGLILGMLCGSVWAYFDPATVPF